MALPNFKKLLHMLRISSTPLDNGVDAEEHVPEIDLEQANKVVCEAASSGKSISECMTALLGYCKEVAPSPDWGKLSGLDYGVDQKLLEDWLRQTLISSRPADGVLAYYFGLFNSKSGGKETIQLYISGSDEYDEDDDSADWASGPVYFPDNRYAPSKVLTQLYQSLPTDHNAFSIGEYVLCLGYACVAVRNLMQSIDLTLLLGGADERVVAVGFDEGDVVTVGKLTRNGFGVE